MRRTIVAMILAAAPLAAPLAACERGASKPAAVDPAAVPEVSIGELSAQLGAAQVRPVDANGTKLRKDVGVIPGAILLSDYETFTAKELPADRAAPLVFYCANEQCGASHEAAHKARVLGYTNVAVLPAGILGWAQAGQPVEKPAAL